MAVLFLFNEVVGLEFTALCNKPAFPIPVVFSDQACAGLQEIIKSFDFEESSLDRDESPVFASLSHEEALIFFLKSAEIPPPPPKVRRMRSRAP